MKKNKASILVVSLIILGAILVIALSISLVSIKERKASIGGGRTNLAYQAAETGAETVLNYLTSNSSEFVKDLTVNCENGKIVDPSANKRYEVVLKDDNGDVIPCNSSDARVRDVASIKSTGIIDPTERRAVEAAVAAGSLKCRRVIDEAKDSEPSLASRANCTAATEFLLSGGGACETGSNFCNRDNRDGGASGVYGSLNVSRPNDTNTGWIANCSKQDGSGEACSRAYAICCEKNPLAISIDLTTP